MEGEGNRGHSSEGDNHLGPGGSEWFLVCYVYTGTFSLFQTIIHFINCRMIINECAIMICHLHMWSRSFSNEPVTMHSRFSYLSFFVKTTIVYALDNVDPDILHNDLRVSFRSSYMLVDKNKS